MRRYRALEGTGGRGKARVVIQREGEALPQWVCDAGTLIEAEMIADALNSQGAVSDRDALRLMLSRLLGVALVDGYGETVADEARALLTTTGGSSTMSVTAGTIKCTTCRGSGEMESSDSTDDRIYKCSACDGTGKIADRRKPDPALRGAVSLADVCEFLRSATYPDPATGGTRHVSGWQSAAVALEREFGGGT